MKLLAVKNNQAKNTSFFKTLKLHYLSVCQYTWKLIRTFKRSEYDFLSQMKYLTQSKTEEMQLSFKNFKKFHCFFMPVNIVRKFLKKNLQKNLHTWRTLKNFCIRKSEHYIFRRCTKNVINWNNIINDVWINIYNLSDINSCFIIHDIEK